MEQSFKPDEIINSVLVRNVIKNLFNNQQTEILHRPASFIIKLMNEPQDNQNKIFRIIILPPHGFTANKIDEVAPYPEARIAKIEIKGGVRPNKSGFNLLKNVIKFQYYTNRNIEIVGNRLYPKINGENYKESTKSSNEKFFVVNEDGTGFYHSLVNLSDEWILLISEKELRLQKLVDLEPKIKKLGKNQQKILTAFYEKVQLYGDTVFEKEDKLIEKICNFDVDATAPVLIEMLNILAAGKHEPCTVYAIILKIGKKNKKVLNYLKEALKNRTAPKYYLQELIKKLGNR